MPHTEEFYELQQQAKEQFGAEVASFILKAYDAGIMSTCKIWQDALDKPEHRIGAMRQPLAGLIRQTHVLRETGFTKEHRNNFQKKQTPNGKS